VDKPLSYFEMFDLVSNGGALFLPDRIVRKVEDIPPDAEMLKAREDAAARQAEAAARGETQALWQILILTIPSRAEFLKTLMERLQPQLVPGVEVVTALDDGDVTIGAKRQSLIENATARYVCFVDDDDLVAPDYVARVMNIINRDDAPDVVGFKLRHYIDGKLAGIAVHSYGAAGIAIQVPHRGVRRHERLPNHLNPVRRELALAVGYKDRNTGEDGDFAQRLAKLRPRPREEFVDHHLYEYLYRSRRPGEVTNELRTAKRR
jgi:hypothetical protein